MAAHDIGKAINPPMLRGQIFGGMTMGMGYAVSEEILIRDGIIENTNFNGYKRYKACE